MKDGLQAVVWDFGGVLTSSPFEAFNRLEAERGLPRDHLRTVNATNPDSNAWALFERNEIDAARFDALFAEESEALGHRVQGRDVLPRLSGDLRPAMVAALKACKAAGLKVGCITNNVSAKPGADGEGGLHGAGMQSNPEKAKAVAEVMALFDQVIESSKAGLRKPNPRIYEMMGELLGVELNACVYLDDLGINCKPAAALGMHAIKVTTEAKALDDLEAATGLTFDRSGLLRAAA